MTLLIDPKSIATWVGPHKQFHTTSANASGFRCATMPNAKHGASFNLRAWHAYALDLGNLGLDLLKTELARF
ncbi:hypothetical protein EMGBS4_06800 [Acidimicrobiaceae bacterium]|nr:hypothetical protein EMGBS4_06800 [Acidimicrobiaceae bacterium]